MMSAVLTEETKPLYHGLHGKEEPEGRQRAKMQLLAKTPEHGESPVWNICKRYSTIDEIGRCHFKNTTLPTFPRP